MVVATLGLLVGFVLFLGGSFTLVAAWMTWRQTPEMLGVFVSPRGLGVAAISVVTGAILFRYFGAVRYSTQKRLAPDAVTVMARDLRPPILYLRSFVDDEVNEPLRAVEKVQRMAQGGALPALVSGLLGSTPGATLTQEEVLAKACRAYGPFIAIGDPIEVLPDLGAARLYPDTENWQAAVSDLMRRARFVIIRPGAGLGLRWEIKQVLTLVPSERIVFWLPDEAPDARHPHKIDEHLRGILSVPLPESAKGAVTTDPAGRRARARFSRLADSLPPRRAGSPFLCFEPGWSNPRFEKLQDLL
jgi:hypothetical protein